MNLMTAMSGGTSTEQFGKAFQAALVDPEVSAIVIDIDSPGGSVFGVAELGRLIYDARGQKPVIAQANSLTASAAYWIASQSDEVVVTPSGEVGSIGVIAHHQDISVAEEMQGVKDTLVTYGNNKAIANPFEPLSESAQAYLQKRVDEYGAMFDQAVARGRGVSVGKVRGEFGQGLMFGAEEAVKLGMADRVGTLQQTLDRLTGRRSSRAGARAAIDTETRLDAADIVWEPVKADDDIAAFLPSEDGEAELPDLRARRLRC
jgi:signal peptide peptidase SppA